MRAIVGLNVQRLRRERGLSQEELSLVSGCTRGYLSGIETGRRNPTVLFLARLAGVLKVDIAEFFVRPKKAVTSTGFSSAPRRRSAGKSDKPVS